MWSGLNKEYFFSFSDTLLIIFIFLMMIMIMMVVVLRRTNKMLIFLRRTAVEVAWVKKAAKAQRMRITSLTSAMVAQRWFFFGSLVVCFNKKWLLATKVNITDVWWWKRHWKTNHPPKSIYSVAYGKVVCRLGDPTRETDWELVEVKKIVHHHPEMTFKDRKHKINLSRSWRERGGLLLD